MVEEQFLTVKEIAELKSCTERYIRILIERGKLESIEIKGLATGQGGIQYRIPLSALNTKLQLKHKRIQRKREKQTQSEAEAAHHEPAAYNDEELTAAEREEIAAWKQLITDWQAFRNLSELSKEQADDEFIKLCNIKNPKPNLTRRTLYRKKKSLTENGGAALVDRRGKHGNHNRKLVKEIWDIFEAFYLDESQKSVSLCVTLTRLELERQKRDGLITELPELPSSDTFIREVNKIPIPHIEYFRRGLKSFIGECAPYIKRMYENLEPNDIWVADNHTFDIMLTDGAGTFRLYLTAFMDVRTRKMMGWCVTEKPCSDATIYALKRGVEKYGIPKMLYTDNGREFLFHDFGGNGFRKKKAETEVFNPPTILKQLGIEFRTALPRNARAKGVERAFLTVKETFSKLFEAYTGGSVAEKPERLKAVVKNPDKLKKAEEFIGFCDTWLAGWYNKQPHSGEGMNGNSPDEAFAELLIEKRIASEGQLNLMFMRWSNPMKVGKNGVTLTFYEKKLQYYDQNLWLNHFGKNVYIRYSPENLKEVRIYDTEERFICTAQLKEELGYDASSEAISKNQKQNRAAVKEVANYLTNKGVKNREALSLILDKASENLAEGENINPKYIRPVFGGERLATKQLCCWPKAVGSEIATDEVIDWTAALANLKNRKDDINGKH